MREQNACQQELHRLQKIIKFLTIESVDKNSCYICGLQEALLALCDLNLFVFYYKTVL